MSDHWFLISTFGPRARLKIYFKKIVRCKFSIYLSWPKYLQFYKAIVKSIAIKYFQRNAENVSKCLSDAARMRSESESCSEHDNERKRGKTRASNENVHFYCHDFFISEKTQDLAQNASEVSVNWNTILTKSLQMI